MKKTILTTLVIMISFCCFAQWENTTDGNKTSVLDKSGDVRIIQQKDNTFALVFSTTDSRFDKAQKFALGKTKDEAIGKIKEMRTALKKNKKEAATVKDANGIVHHLKSEKPEGAKKYVLKGHTNGAKGLWTIDEPALKKALKLLK